jgi:hypothetical protein
LIIRNADKIEKFNGGKGKMGNYKQIGRFGAAIFVAIVMVISGMGPLVGSVKADGPTALEPSTLPLEEEGVTEEQGEIRAIESLDPNAIALLIQDVNPWYGRNVHHALHEFVIPHDLINSSSLATWDLSQYKFILYASSQTDNYYVNIAANLDKISTWVSNGGLLIAHCMDGGWYVIWPYQIPGGSWQGLSILPGGVTHLMHRDDMKYAADMIHITEPNHGVVKSDEYTLTDSYLAIWYTSTCGIFTNLPPNAEVVMVSNEGDGGDGPTYIDYNYGSGKVLATLNTVEWGYYNGLQYFWGRNRPELLRNELRYALNYTPQAWSFAIITDLHVGRDAEYKDYDGPGWNDSGPGEENIAVVRFLKQSVDLINSYKDEYNIQFVAVLGDISESAELSQFDKAIEILNSLEIPWVPLIGNHDIWPYCSRDSAPEVEQPGSRGTDRHFDDKFGSQYGELSALFDNWEKADVFVWNPEVNPPHNSYFQNFAFDYCGYHFVGIDFNYRDDAALGLPGVRPEGNLHNFSDGTWNWFTNHIEQYVSEHPESNENIILFAHHPLNKGWVEFDAFSQEKLRIMANFLKNYKTNVFAEFAGHIHRNWYSWLASGFSNILNVIETNANMSDPLVRIVQIAPDGNIDYSKFLNKNDIAIKAYSPIDLVVTDPDNLIISKDSNQIPGASYMEIHLDGDGTLDDLVQIPGRKIGEYSIEVIPEPGAQPTDTYTIEVSTIEDSFGWISVILADNVTIEATPTEPYGFQSTERKATQLSYTGDLSGVCSAPVNLRAVLVDGNGAPLPEKTVTFGIGGQSASAVTDTSGLASTTIILNQEAGQYYFIDAYFGGDEYYLPAFDSEQFEIRIPATMDFDPNTLNLKSKGQWVTVYIEFPTDYNVNDIDVSTVTLDNAISVDLSAPSTIGDYNSNGVLDLMIKFSGAEVTDYILSKGTGQENITLNVSGELLNETSFTGSDFINIIVPKK